MGLEFSAMSSSQSDFRRRAEAVTQQPEALIKPTMTPDDWQKVHQAWAVKRAIAAIMGPVEGPWNQ